MAFQSWLSSKIDFFSTSFYQFSWRPMSLSRICPLREGTRSALCVCIPSILHDSYNIWCGIHVSTRKDGHTEQRKGRRKEGRLFHFFPRFQSKSIFYSSLNLHTIPNLIQFSHVSIEVLQDLVWPGEWDLFFVFYGLVVLFWGLRPYFS